MKKARYIELRDLERQRKKSVAVYGVSINGMDKPAGSKLARKAGENALARPVGVVGKALEQLARNKRAA